MADTEKGGGDSTTSSKAKGKMSNSLLDDDISKDFNFDSSWKSMSKAGSDDMDFNFEPVTKGNKKAFDFGKLDMDFSLDGDFGKLSSFKLDMPDLDFSSSPKKSMKSKDKPEDESVKGKQKAKNDPFAFSFDFNGMDDFSFDTPSTKGGKKSSTAKCSDDVDSANAMDCEESPRQGVTEKYSNDDPMSSRRLASDNAINPKSVDQVDGKGNSEVSSINCPPESAVSVDLVQQNASQISEEKHAIGAPLLVDQNHLTEETLFEKSHSPERARNSDSITERKPPKLASEPAGVESEEALLSSGTTITAETKSTDEETDKIIADLTLSGSQVPLPACPGRESKVSNQGNAKLIDKIADTVAVQKSNINEAKKHASLKLGKLQSGLPSLKISSSEAPSTKRGSQFGRDKSLNEADSISETECKQLPRLVVDDNGAREDTVNQRGPKDAADSDNVDEGNHHVSSSMSESAMPECLRQLDGNHISLKEKMGKAPEVVHQSHLTEKASSVKSCAEGPGHDLQSPYGKKSLVSTSISTANVVEPPVSLESNLITNEARTDDKGDKKSIHERNFTSIQFPTSMHSGRETILGNQNLGKRTEKIADTASIPKSNVREMNKLSSLNIGKKLPVLPMLKISRNPAVKKSEVSPAVHETARSQIHERSGRLQSMTKMVPPITAEKQRPTTPSLKRKLSEAADMSLTKQHPSKRLSPNNTRIFEQLSAREVEDVHSPSTVLEGRRTNTAAEYMMPKFGYHQEANMEEVGFNLTVESDANVEKAEACAKELEHICNMLRKKHDEAKEILVRALVNNNNLLMLNHPVYEEKINAVQKFADRLMFRELKAEA